MKKLYSPTKVGSIEVKNRVFLAPLTRNRANPDGMPGDLTGEYYAQRASGGLLISEATQISPMGKGYINTPGIHNGDQAAKWATVTKAVHEKGGKIVMQLWHVGRISHTSLLPNGASPVAPSAIRAKSQTFTGTQMVDVSQPIAMSKELIQSTIADYKKAAQHAKNAGFDGIEVHGANGYLIDQFLQDKTNQRSDEYGGTIENRMRFLNEILAAVIEVWGADKVGLRLSPTGRFNDMGDSDPLKNFGAVISSLNSYKLAYLHVIEKFPGLVTSTHDTEVLQKLRKMWKGFYIANGDYDADSAEAAIESQKADAIAFGRSFLANPDLPKRLQMRAPLNPPNPATFYGGGKEGYTDYPFLAN